VSALGWYDANRSGFGEPLSTQAVDLLEAGFGAGRARLDLGGARSRHALFAGYGWATPPVSGAWAGQQVARRLPLPRTPARLARGSAAPSPSPATSIPTAELPPQRALVEAVALSVWRLGRRFDLLAGLSIGVAGGVRDQPAARQRDHPQGDAAGMRAGGEVALRFRLRGRTALILDAAMAVDVLRQCTSSTCKTTSAHPFFEPQITLLVEQEL